MTKQQDLNIPFGRYRDKLIADVPNNYLNWLLDQDWFCIKHPVILEQIKIELSYRKKFNITVEE